MGVAFTIVRTSGTFTSSAGQNLFVGSAIAMVLALWILPRSRRPLKGLWLANMFQIYPHDRGQNYSFDLANQLVRQLQKA